MAEKSTELAVKYLDRRTVERYQKKGIVEEKELARVLKALPDLAEQAQKIETEYDDGLGPIS
jgi:hypothetical protein